MKDYYFIRHGESVANRDGWLAGHQDSPLTQRGLEEARRAAPLVQSLAVDLVLVSDLRRALQTADVITTGLDLPTTCTPSLRERCAGQWETTPIAELRSEGFMKRIRSWHVRPPGGESLNDVALRAVGTLVEAGDQNVLVVAHGALIRAVLHALHNGPKGTLSDWKPLNGELVHRKVALEDWTVLLEKLMAARDAAP